MCLSTQIQSKDDKTRAFFEKVVKVQEEEICRRQEDAVKRYTYIALWFDRVILRCHFPAFVKEGDDGWRFICTTRDHHITIGYLPWVDQRERRDLETSMSEVLDEWQRTPPDVRPTSLLTSRCILIGRHARDLRHIQMWRQDGKALGKINLGEHD